MLPDWEDLESTSPSLDGVQLLHESCVRLAGAQRADAMTERQMAFGFALACLEHDAQVVTVFDRSARAALDTLRTRVGELTDLREALDELHAVAPSFHADGALTAFAFGLYSWSEEVIGALAEVARGLRYLSPDWARARNRLDRAAEWYFDGLREEVRREAAAAPELAMRVEEVLWAAAVLHEGLKKRFG
jgi:hypothetical protein